MTIEGAKRRLRQKKDDKPSFSNQSLKSIREELREILEILA
jgi:hypothetical protein